MSKIIDAFTFFCEVELLSLRLDYLSQYVDQFVISEAMFSHSGKVRQPVLHDLLKDHPIRDRISIVVADNFYTGNRWDYEVKQREALSFYIDTATSENDLILISDIDEFPSIHAIDAIRGQMGQRDLVYIFRQQNIFHRFNNAMLFDKRKSRLCWNGTCAFYASERLRPQFIRQQRWKLSDPRLNLRHLDSAGWHFSSVGKYNWKEIKTLSTSHADDPGMRARINRDMILDYKSGINFGDPNQFFAAFHPSHIYQQKLIELIIRHFGTDAFEEKLQSPLEISARLLNFLRSAPIPSEGFSAPPEIDFHDRKITTY